MIYPCVLKQRQALTELNKIAISHILHTPFISDTYNACDITSCAVLLLVNKVKNLLKESDAGHCMVYKVLKQGACRDA